MEFENISLMIIAGGKSSRLGQDKRFVKVGGVPMLENILRKANACDFAEMFLCVEENLPALDALAKKFGATLLVDKIKDAGAMAGIANGLAHCKSDWYLAVSADMPFFDFEVLNAINVDAAQAIIPLVEGKFQMLAAFYHKDLADLFQSELSRGQRKIFNAIKKVPHATVEISAAELFFNVNTPADLQLARGRAENLSRRTPIISIVAPASGTGKTTFIEKLVRIFSAQGISIGVIKSDAHGFNLDVEGKDSWKFQNAGAKSVAVVSPKSWFMIQQTNEREDFLRIADKMSVDLILTESRTHETFPAISLCRGKGEVVKNKNTAAIFTSKPENVSDIYQFDLNDTASAEKICKFLSGIDFKRKSAVNNLILP